MSSIGSGYTDAQGKLVFINLEPGVYFGKMTKEPAGENHVEMTPFIVTVPWITKEGISYDVPVDPKYAYHSIFANAHANAGAYAQGNAEYNAHAHDYTYAHAYVQHVAQSYAYLYADRPLLGWYGAGVPHA